MPLSDDTARDLARMLPNGRLTLPGVVTAGQLSAEQFRAAAVAGMKTVLDLRPPDEARGYDEPATAREAGVDYRCLPVTAASLGTAQFAEVRRVIGDLTLRPLLIHCATANRVGAVLIPHLVLDQGMDSREALRVAREIGLRNDELARSAFEYVGRETAEPTI